MSAPVQPPVPTPTGSSPTVQARAEQSQSQTATVAQPTSQAVQDHGSQLIGQSQPQQLTTRQQVASTVLRATQLGQQMVTTGAKLHDMVDSASEFEARGVKPLEKLGELTEAISEAPVEGALFEAVSGMSAETVGSASGALEGATTVLQACKTVHSLHQAYNSIGTADFGDRAVEAASQTFVTLGGEPTKELCSSISSFCQERSVDNAKEVLTAMAELSTDDSLVSGLTRSAICSASTATLGSGATDLLAQAAPGLSFGVAALDSGLALKSGYDYYYGQNNVTGRDVVRSTITAIGSGTGATVAPVVGPLAATVLNTSIDVTLDYVVPTVAPIASAAYSVASTGASMAYSGASMAYSGASAGYDYLKSWWA
ncbi:MAG: hypothetical protein CVV27_05425 [Candidatus Melainabacteria bacterium HGW-Melainabacteria-1]|nr:MAG: hypothetical protein CVV27_05425 [Candidatus Melainabacteria bacterium HGW-Melainabacteria-1]